MEQPILAEGIEKAFMGIVRLDARKAALACLAGLSQVALIFRKVHPGCNPQVLDLPAAIFPMKVDDPAVIREFQAVQKACNQLSEALEDLGPNALELIGQIPTELQDRDFWSPELRHWVRGNAGEFFPVQDYEVCNPGEELIPKGGKPDQAPILQRLTDVAAMMACLSKESKGWSSAAARFENYANARETREAKVERNMIRSCGEVLLQHGQGLANLRDVAEAVFVWGLGENPGTQMGPSWQTRAFKEIRKELRGWCRPAHRVDDGVPF